MLLHLLKQKLLTVGITVLFFVSIPLAPSILHAQTSEVPGKDCQPAGAAATMADFNKPPCSDSSSSPSSASTDNSNQTDTNTSDQSNSQIQLLPLNSTDNTVNPAASEQVPSAGIDNENAPQSSVTSGNVSDQSSANSGQSFSLSDFGPTPTAINDQDLSQFDSPNTSNSFFNEPYNPINVPLKNQNDPANGALGPTACAPTALDMVAAFYGINVPTTNLISMANTTSVGTNFPDLISTAEQIGLTNTTGNVSGISGVVSGLADAFSGGSVALSSLTSAVSAGNPAIVDVDLSPFDNGHALVVTGISGGNVYVNNPWNGTTQIYGQSQFMSMWASKGYGYIVPKP